MSVPQLYDIQEDVQYNTRRNRMSGNELATWEGKLKWNYGEEYNETVCKILSVSKVGESNLNMNIWQNKVTTCIFPMKFLKTVHSKYNRTYKTVYVYPQPSGSAENLVEVMSPNCYQIYHQPKSLLELSAHAMGKIITNSALNVLGKCSQPTGRRAAITDSALDYLRKRSEESGCTARITNSAVNVLRRHFSSFSRAYSERCRNNPESLVASTAKFFDMIIPRHLHNIVTRQSLACIPYDNSNNIFQNNYEILDIFIRSQVTEIDFSTELCDMFLMYCDLKE